VATGDEITELAIGTIDGLNQDFSTSLPYEAGTLWVSPDGILVDPSHDDGWTETDPVAGTFRMKIAPRGGARPDTLMVQYIEG
jgi:hypothetical protein